MAQHAEFVAEVDGKREALSGQLQAEVTAKDAAEEELTRVRGELAAFMAGRDDAERLLDELRGELVE